MRAAVLLLLALGALAANPTHKPTHEPTVHPTTTHPTSRPTSGHPTPHPTTTHVPTSAAPTTTAKPTQEPTAQPTKSTESPTTVAPVTTSVPTANPVVASTGQPTSTAQNSTQAPVTSAPVAPPTITPQFPFTPVTALPQAVSGTFFAETDQVIGNGSDVYVVDSVTFSGGQPDGLTGSLLNFTWVQNTSYGWTALSANITTSACGQVVQQEYAFGVIGGNWSMSELICGGDSCYATSQDYMPGCLYFQRLSATQNKTGQINVEFFWNPVNDLEEAPPGVVGCPREKPASEFSVTGPIVGLYCVDGNGLIHNCITTPRAQCVQQTNQYAVGVGMSVGGVGVLLISLISILAINKLVKSA